MFILYLLVSSINLIISKINLYNFTLVKKFKNLNLEIKYWTYQTDNLTRYFELTKFSNSKFSFHRCKGIELLKSSKKKKKDINYILTNVYQKPLPKQRMNFSSPLGLLVGQQTKGGESSRQRGQQAITGDTMELAPRRELNGTMGVYIYPGSIVPSILNLSRWVGVKRQNAGGTKGARPWG